MKAKDRSHLKLVASNGELLAPVVKPVIGFQRWHPRTMTRAEFIKTNKSYENHLIKQEDRDNEDNTDPIA
jgi:hypothetical protein